MRADRPTDSYRRQGVEEEQLLLHADDAVVALLRLFDLVLVLLELLCVGERDAVHALERRLGGVGLPVRRRVLRHLHRLDPARVRHVRPAAEVDERTALVRRARLAVGHLRADDLLLERVVLEQLERLVLRQHKPLERLLLLHDVVDELLDGCELLGGDGVPARRHVVEEAVLGGRAEGQMRAVFKLERLAENVRGRMPERVLPLLVLELQNLERAVVLQRSFEIERLAVDLRKPRPLGEPRPNRRPTAATDGWGVRRLRLRARACARVHRL
jgi:hypothetical protein